METGTDNWGRLDTKARQIKRFEADKLTGSPFSLLPFGNGRSYGDSCHNDDGVLLDARQRNTILNFDTKNGTLRAQSGALLADLLIHLKDSGWFLPVVPGTRFVTLGGAIANDIHGKNHGHRGTFGCHVESLTLVRSDGTKQVCTAGKNVELYRATIGGMGLTGFITEAEIRLMRVPSHFVRETNTPFGSLNEFMALAEEAESKHEYSVAWIDSLARGKRFGRGILIAGDHVESQQTASYDDPRLSIPFTPPLPLVSGLPLKAFNFTYYHAKARKGISRKAQPSGFFFPLDAIDGWNRLYGPKGLYQHQSVIPLKDAEVVLRDLIATSQRMGQGSFLTVLKRFGGIVSPGLMSFPQPGYTLTLDFPNRGEKTTALLGELDRITISAGGRVNPYKDARMSAATYQSGFPDWEKLEDVRDTAIMSDFWRRVAARKVVDAPPLSTNAFPSPVNHARKPQLHEGGSQSPTPGTIADKPQSRKKPA